MRLFVRSAGRRCLRKCGFAARAEIAWAKARLSTLRRYVCQTLKPDLERLERRVQELEDLLLPVGADALEGAREEVTRDGT